MSEDRDSILGKPYHEVSDMAATTTTGSVVLIYGDIAATYTIVDRVGMTLEIIGHLFGANRRPTGQRGAYGYFRVGAVVTNTNAARALVVA